MQKGKLRKTSRNKIHLKKFQMQIHNAQEKLFLHVHNKFWPRCQRTAIFLHREVELRRCSECHNPVSEFLLQHAIWSLPRLSACACSSFSYFMHYVCKKCVLLKVVEPTDERRNVTSFNSLTCKFRIITTFILLEGSPGKEFSALMLPYLGRND